MTLNLNETINHIIPMAWNSVQLLIPAGIYLWGLCFLSLAYVRRYGRFLSSRHSGWQIGLYAYLVTHLGIKVWHYFIYSLTATFNYFETRLRTSRNSERLINIDRNLSLLYFLITLMASLIPWLLYSYISSRAGNQEAHIDNNQDIFFELWTPLRRPHGSEIGNAGIFLQRPVDLPNDTSDSHTNLRQRVRSLPALNATNSSKRSIRRRTI